jgi:hypothetical protein
MALLPPHEARPRVVMDALGPSQFSITMITY